MELIFIKLKLVKLWLKYKVDNSNLLLWLLLVKSPAVKNGGAIFSRESNDLVFNWLSLPGVVFSDIYLL
jgi:hypothetical protein